MPHIFNPEHDIVLALNAGQGFTPPKAARKLRADLCRLPSLWVKDEEVSVWGWDAAVVAELTGMGVAREKMPTDEQLRQIRALSNRSLAVEMLAALRQIDGTVGRSAVCRTFEEVTDFAKDADEIVLKAPWSSSGRGVKPYSHTGGQHERWIRNTIGQQGSIIAEQKCNRVIDFAMEYEADAEGNVHYRGLSIFDTVNGAYKGNLLLEETTKRQMLSRYVPMETLGEVSARIKAMMADRVKGIYTGPFGVDMMICKRGDDSPEGSAMLLNPCVEINLRRTMGHVALALTEKGYGGTMTVTYDKETDKYELRINQEKIL